MRSRGRTDIRRIAVIGAAAALWAGLLILYILLLRKAVGGVDSREVSDWIYYGLMGAAALLVLARVVCRPQARFAWALIGIGAGGWLAGDIAYQVLADAPGPVPYPSVAELFYLSQYVFLLLGLYALGARLRRGPESLSLLVGILGIATIWSWLVFGEVIESVSGDTAAVAVSLAYPLLDLVLVAAAVLALAARDWRLDPPFACLILALVLLGLSDMIYAVQVAADTYNGRSLVNAGWPLAAGFLALAAWLRESESGTGLDGRRLVPVLTTSMAALGAGVLIVDHFQRVDTTTIVLAIATMAASVAQMAVLFLRHDAAQRRASASEALRSASTEASLDCVISFDADGLIREWNEAASATFGVAREDAIGMSVGELVDPPQDAEEAREAIATIGRQQPGHTGERLEMTGRRGTGGTFPMESGVTRVQEDPPMYTAYIRDITDRLRREEENERLAAIVRSSEDAIVSLDLDGVVTAWNHGAQELYGYSPAEAVGQPIRRLVVPRERLPEMDRMVAEVLEGGSAELETQRVSKSGEVLDVSLRAFPIRSLGGGVVGMSTSAHDVTERRRRERREERERTRRMWRARVRDAMAEGRLRFCGQPVVDTASRLVHHHELLLRMELDGKLVTPNAFLPHAEGHELMGEIDRWAIDHGCALARDLPVAINLSARSLSNPRLPEFAASALERAGADPADVIFEITETAAAENLESASTLVGALRALGCGVALDDFGTGYGSFTYLKYLPVTQLKIDITFIRELARDAVDRRVVNSIVAVADNFSMQTVAEGVEDEATAELLREMGVDLLQGFLIGRPEPVDPTAAGVPSRA